MKILMNCILFVQKHKKKRYDKIIKIRQLKEIQKGMEINVAHK